MVDEEKKPAEEPAQQPQPSPIPAYPPYYAPYLSSPQPAPAKDNKKVLLASIVVMIVAFAAIGAGIFYSMMSSMNYSGTNDLFDGNVTLSSGAHFKISSGWSGSMIWIFMNVTTGANIDVYLMNTPQYDGTYGNYTPAIFSATRVWENVDTLSQTYEFQMAQMSDLLVVFDNMDNPLRTSDAVPTGQVEIDVHIVSYYNYAD